MASCPELIPRQFRKGAVLAAEALKSLKSPLIAAHVRPDGDAVGALLACGWMELELGHNFALYVPDGIPEYLAFLEKPGPIYRSLGEIPFKPESAIYVDLSEPGRLGPELEKRHADWPSVNIDHHLCAHGLGSVANFISAEAAATCQLVAYVADALGIPLRGAIGADIAAGLITDTGNYTHANISGPVFCLSAELENNGVHIAAVGHELRSGWTLNRLRLWGYLFTQVRQTHGNRIAWTLIPEAELERHNCHAEDLEGYIDILGRLRDVEIAFTLRESREAQAGGGKIVSRLSMRSKGDYNVREICARFGGGGHRNASGATLMMPPADALPRILKAIDKYLEENHFWHPGSDLPDSR